MWVRVKTPLTARVAVEGAGARDVVEALRQHFGPIELLDEDDTDEEVDIMQTDWARQMAAEVTPGVALHEFRTLRGLTLQQLADRSGIPNGNLSKMEHGKRPIGPKSARTLAKALSCDHRHFL